jgi:hypothetical protein
VLIEAVSPTDLARKKLMTVMYRSHRKCFKMDGDTPEASIELVQQMVLMFVPQEMYNDIIIIIIIVIIIIAIFCFIFL